MDPSDYAPGPSGHGQYEPGLNLHYCPTCGNVGGNEYCCLQHIAVSTGNLNHGWIPSAETFQRSDNVAGPSTSTSHWNSGYTNGASWTQESQSFGDPITNSTSWSSAPDVSMYNFTANNRQDEGLPGAGGGPTGLANHPLESACQGPRSSHTPSRVDQALPGTGEGSGGLGEHPHEISPQDQRSPHNQARRDQALPSQLPDATERLMTPLLLRCLAQTRMPLEREVRGMAMSEDVPEEEIEAWFSRKLPDYIASAARNGLKTDFDVTNASNVTVPPEIREEVREYARQQFHTKCESAQSKKAAGKTGKYQCTSGCGYSVDTQDSWKRHEQKRQAQDFWHCVLCRSVSKRSFICPRKDKVLDHFAKSHQELHVNDYESIRDESKVSIEPVFERQCKFWNGSGPCSYIFKSWKDRIQHYVQHFCDKIRDGPWQLRFDRKRRFDRDDGPGPNGSQTGTSSSGMASAITKYGAMSAHGGQVSDNRRPTKRRAGDCLALGASIHVSGWMSSIRSAGAEIRGNVVLSRKLIDVVNLSWADVTAKLKYVALDDFPTHDCIKGHAPEYELKELAAICAPCREALSLTRDMGYDYLWSEQLCETYDNVEQRQLMFQQAVLILVRVPSSRSNNTISYYTCHYDNIQRVRAWAFEDITIRHIQNLGHGAFGIVDEVRLGLAPDLYARKMLLGPKSQKMLKSKQFHEVEIMQKLRHQNIAAFVAAYSDHRSLNILMQPVAECSLREFLVEPTRWLDKLEHIPRWFCSLASAVSYMHGLRLRHKDIKPANILIRDCEVYLSDFGTALDFSMTTSGSDGGGPMTPRYCAPEVANRLPRGRKADVFSLGCVFLELATVEQGWSLEDLNDYLGFGKPPVTTQAAYCARSKACTRWVKKLLRDAVSRYQRTALQICSKMLAWDAADRPTASAVHDTLVGSASSMPLPSHVNRPLLTSPAYASEASSLPWLDDLSSFGISTLGHKPLSNRWEIPACPRTYDGDVWSFGCLCLEWLLHLMKPDALHLTTGKLGTGTNVLTDLMTDDVTTSARLSRTSEKSSQTTVARQKILVSRKADRAYGLLGLFAKDPPDNLHVPVWGGLLIRDQAHALATLQASEPSLWTLRQSSVDLRGNPNVSKDMTPPFEHRSSGPNQIRLLRLHCGTGDDPLGASLITCDLDSSPAYEAISYAWGEDSATSSILLSGAGLAGTHRRSGLLKTRPNLHKALEHLRPREQSRVLWIDAICINQADPEERSDQVSKLARIYEQADSVLVWLEDHLPPSPFPDFNSMHTLPDFGAEETLNVLEAPKDGKTLNAHRLMDRQDLQRRWMIQELTLARQITVLNPSQIELKALWKASWSSSECRIYRLSDLSLRHQRHINLYAALDEGVKYSILTNLCFKERIIESNPRSPAVARPRRGKDDRYRLRRLAFHKDWEGKKQQQAIDPPDGKRARDGEGRQQRGGRGSLRSLGVIGFWFEA